MAWKGREIVIDHMRNVDHEMIECGVTTDDVLEVLEEGVCPVKRKKGIMEKWLRIERYVTMVVVEDCQDYWLVRHVTRIRVSKRLLKVAGGAKNET